MALQVLDDIEGDLECLDDEQVTDKVRKFERTFVNFAPTLNETRDS